MPAPAYTFSPQFATIRSASPLEGMRPVSVVAPVTQHTPLEFATFEPLKIRSEQPELVTGGIASGLKEGVGGALQGITAAYVGEREKKEGLLKEEREHTRAKELAGIRAQKTPDELEYEKQYQDLRLQNLRSQVEERGGNKPKASQPVIPAGRFQTVEPELPSKSKPDFSIPEGAMDGVSALQNIPPPIAQTMPEATPAEALKKRMAEQKEEDLQKLRMQIAQESTQAPLASIPIPKNVLSPEGIVASQTDFSQLPLVAIDEGSAEELQKQPSPASLPPGTFPQTPQQMGDFAEQQLLARNQALQEITPALDEMQRREANAQVQGQGMEPVLLPGEVSVPVGPNEFLGRYESFQDAIYANEQLGKLLPGYQTQEIVEGVDENGMSFYEVKVPVRKAQGTISTGVPEGLKVKSGKLDETGKIIYDLEPELPKEKQIAALKQPLATNDTMLKAIQQIKGIYKGLSPATGLIGSVMQWIPASDASDVRKLVKALTGNIAFKALADMRAASPTGGALGAVTERELDMLASTMGSIDPGLSPDLFTENINRIEEILTKYNQNAVKQIEELEKPQNFQSIQSQENRVEIKSQEDYNKLKSGQKYIWNGNTGTKK